MLCRNDQIFSSCIRDLFNVLSKWNPRRHNLDTKASAGISLEIMALSPSDNKHHQYSCTLSDDYPIRFESDLCRISTGELKSYRGRMDCRNWVPWYELNGHPNTSGLRRRPFLYSLHRGRLHGTPLQLRPTVPALPKVPIVKALLLRRQPYRSIGVGPLAQILMQSLMALESFRLERRRPIMPSERDRFNEGETEYSSIHLKGKALIRRGKTRVYPVPDTCSSLDPAATIFVRVPAVLRRARSQHVQEQGHGRCPRR